MNKERTPPPSESKLRAMLQTQLVQAQIKNPSFSLRALAKKIGIAPSTLSMVLVGKRKLSRKAVEQIADKLALSPAERAELWGKDAASPVKGEVLHYEELPNDQFRLIAEWENFALLNYVTIPGRSHAVPALSDALGISVPKVTASLELLKRLGMLERKNGRYRRVKARYKTSDQVVNLALRKSHAETLEIAREKLAQEAFEHLDYTWVTVPLALEKMSDVKALIRKFQDDLHDIVEAQKDPAAVYRCAVQLFPLTKVSLAKEKEDQKQIQDQEKKK